jgi:phosphoribosylamine--glycine ligase
LNLNAIISNRTGEPYVLEFNARFGDPEAQGVAMLVDSGLAAHLNAVAGGSDKPTVPKTIGSACVVVVLASKGYPTSQSIGDKITIRPLTDKNVTIFHAGTARTPAGELVTAGGRVLNVAATGPTVESARRQVYKVIDTHVEFSGMQYRSDIGVGRTRRRNLQAPRSA